MSLIFNHVYVETGSDVASLYTAPPVLSVNKIGEWNFPLK